MPATLFLVLGILLLLLLAALVWWRFKGGGQPKDEAPIATTNHKSLPSFHYASAPAAPQFAPASAAPPLITTSPLALLLPEDGFFRQQLELQAEADRAEAEKMEQREQAQFPTAASVTEETTPEITLPAATALAPTPPDGVSATASVLDVLSPDERPTASPAAAETPASPAEPEDEADDTLAESIYDNPLTSPTPTRNDEANRLAAVALRQRKRAAIMAKSGDQKTALVALLVNK